MENINIVVKMYQWYVCHGFFIIVASPGHMYTDAHTPCYNILVPVQNKACLETPYILPEAPFTNMEYL